MRPAPLTDARRKRRSVAPYLAICFVVSGITIFLFWSWITDDTALAADRTRRALPFVVLSGLALFIPFRRELRARNQMTRALLRANEAMAAIARLGATGTERQPTLEVLSELLRVGTESVHADVAALYVRQDDRRELKLFLQEGDGFPVDVEATGDGLVARALRQKQRVRTIGDDRAVAAAGLPACESWVAVPLVHGHDELGALVVGFPGSSFADEDEDRIIQVIADRATAVLRTAAISDAARRSRLGADHARQQLALLAQGSKALVGGLEDYATGLRLLVDVIVPEFADWCVIDLVEAGEIRRVAAKDVDVTVDPFALDDPARAWAEPCRRVMATGASELDWDGRTESGFTPLVPGLTSHLAVPIRLRGLSVGSICCGTRAPRRGFRSSDLAALEDLSGQIATALERVSLYQATERSGAESAGRAAQLRRLMDAAVAIQAQRGLHQTAVVVAEQARRLLGTKQAMVFVPGENRDAIKVVMSGERDPRALEDVDEEVLYALSKAQDVPGHVAHVADLDTGEVSALVARLSDGTGSLLGVLAVSNKEHSAFTDDDEPILVSLAQLASIALDNAHLYESLRAGEDRLRALIDASPVAIIEFDEHANARLWNQAASDLLGTVAWQPEGAALTFHPDTAKLFARLGRDVRSGQPVLVEDLAWRPDGTEVPLSLVAAPLRAASGQVNGAVVMARDVTERQQLQDQLTRAQRLEAVGQIAGGVAHDFNNLLTVILGHAELLEIELGEEHPGIPDVIALRAAAERAASVTSQLLTISRGDLAAVEVFEPRLHLQRLQATLRSLLPDSIELEVDISGGRSYVRMSPAQFDQLFLNLAVNARDSMPDGGTLTVSLWDDDEHVVLAVRDTGEGMDEATKARCFEPFFTTKGAARGTGLGLATVYTVVTGAGGTIAVDSEVGRGTTFTLSLLRVAGQPRTDPGEVAVLDVGGTGSILLVEDQDGVRQLAVEVLRSAGYDVTAAPDGAAALEHLQAASQLPDLLVTDVVMPRMNGIELARRVRETFPSVPILFMSGYAESATREELAGAEILTKPFLLRDLTTKVREVIERSMAEQLTRTPE